MRTNTFIKALAFTMLLATACNKSEIANDENTDKKGFALPVTVNVTREGDDATKATYNESTKKLAFSAGDKLLVRGNDNSVGGAGMFAGLLDYDSEKGKFSGTIYTQNSYSGTADALFTTATANWVGAALFPSGYGSYEFLSLSGSGYSTSYSMSYNKAIAATKAAAIEQFSLETAKTYSSGFALSPENAIFNFTITGLTDGEKAVTLKDGDRTMFTGSVTPSSGTAAFALGAMIKNYMDFPVNLKNLTLTIGGTDIDITETNKNLEAGKIYNINRAAPAATDLSTINANYTASNGETLTGTLASNVQISIADGATVILNGVSINADGYWKSGDYAGITCLGDATIILSGTNTVKGFFEDHPGIQAAVGKTLTIQGSGSLTASSNGWGAGIGGGYCISCGNITITGGTITATGGENAAGIGGGQSCSCGDITITSGVTHVTATKGEDATNSIGAGVAGTCGTVTIEDSSKVTQN